MWKGARGVEDTELELDVPEHFGKPRDILVWMFGVAILKETIFELLPSTVEFDAKLDGEPMIGAMGNVHQNAKGGKAVGHVIDLGRLVDLSFPERPQFL